MTPLQQKLFFRPVMLFYKKIFSRNLLAALSELLKKGVGLPDALEALTAIFPLAGRRLAAAAEELRNGVSLAGCCSGPLKFLPKLFKRLLSLGEEQGLVLEFIGLRSSAGIGTVVMHYWGSLSILLLSWLVVSTILVFVIPTFDKMFSDFGGQLPLLTRLVIAVSNVLCTYLLLFIIAAVLLFYLLRRTGLYKLLLPLRVRYARLMASATTLMLQHNKPLQDAIRISAGLTGNRAIEKGGAAMLQQMHNGEEPLRVIMAEHRLPRDYRLFLATLLTPEGATTPGHLLLECLTDRLDLELEFFHRKVIYLSVLLASLLVGLLVIAMYLPIFRLARTVTV